MANPRTSHIPEAYYQCARQGDYLTACDEEWLTSKDDMDILDLVSLDKEIKRREIDNRETVVG